MSVRLTGAIVVGVFAAASADASTIAYYQFNGTVGSTISATDSSGNGLNGTVSGTPSYLPGAVSTVPQTGQTDPTGAYFGGDHDYVTFNYAFPFETQTNATLEFWLNPNSAFSSWGAWGGDLFWTNLASGDSNRFNIEYIPSQQEVYIDYREPNGTIHLQAATGTNTVIAGQWTAVEIVKQGSTYELYTNGILRTTITDTSPNLPTATGWSINGTDDYSGVGGSPANSSFQMDEVRLSNTALSPSQFLDSTPPAVPEPGTIAVVLGATVFGLRRRLGHV